MGKRSEHRNMRATVFSMASLGPNPYSMPSKYGTMTYWEDPEQAARLNDGWQRVCVSRKDPETGKSGFYWTLTVRYNEDINEYETGAYRGNERQTFRTEQQVADHAAALKPASTGSRTVQNEKAAAEFRTLAGANAAQTTKDVNRALADKRRTDKVMREWEKSQTRMTPQLMRAGQVIDVTPSRID